MIYNLKEYQENVKYLKSLGKKVGCNLLLDPIVLENLEIFCKVLFEKVKIDRVFLLIPKPRNGLDVLKYRFKIIACSIRWKHLYVDDALNKVITENKYEDWDNCCHYGLDMFSVNFDGGISGCSFNPNKEFYLNEPKDILKAKDFEFEKRFKCPYL